MRRLYIDWDCTITANHQYSLFRPSRSNRDFEDFKHFVGSELPMGVVSSGFGSIVNRLVSQYKLWGKSSPRALEELTTIVMKDVKPLINMSDVNEAQLYEKLREFLFGDSERQAFLSTFMEKLCKTNSVEVIILTKGLAGAVYSAIKSYFPHWCEYPLLKIVDFAGFILYPYSMLSNEDGEENGNEVKIDGYIVSIKPKVEQILDFEKSGKGLNEPSSITMLIDDSYQEEIGLKVGNNANKVIETESESFVMYDKCSIADGLEIYCGGSPKNGTGVSIEDGHVVLDLIMQLISSSS
jgi:hypothetical protein